MGRLKSIITDLDLVDEFVEQAAAELQQEIDREIMFAALKESLGWHLVTLDSLKGRKHAVDLSTWLDKNCTGEFHTHGREFLFKNRQDAVMFALRWL